MHLFAQLAFGCALPASRGYPRWMTQFVSSRIPPRWRAAAHMLGRTLTLTLLLMALVSIGMVACGGSSGSDTVAAAPAQTGQAVQPVDTGSTGGAGSGNAGGNTNAATMLTTTFALQVTELNTSLSSPWGLAFLPDGRMLVTEKAGTLKLLAVDGSTVGTVTGVPKVNSSGQGGLLDVVIDPAYASNQRIYMTFAENDSANSSLSGTAVARAKLDASALSLSDVTVIYRQTPKVASSGHFGSRMVFDRNGYLFVALGDRQSRDQRGFAQDLTRGHGKVMRISTEGMPAPGNPSFTVTNAQIAIWSYGHRNPQGAALHPTTGELWMNEHGPQGGDEINRAEAGKNYGWPIISYGQEYGLSIQVGEGTAKAGMEQPVSYWLTRDGSPLTGLIKSSMAPSGMAFYNGTKFPEYNGNIFNGALAGTALWRIVLGGADGKTEIFRERLLANRGERIRDVRQGPDGWIYLLTDNGKLLRVSRS
jgi:aldose sugar dehydrogenase